MHDADSSNNDSFEESFDSRKDNFESSQNSNHFKSTFNSHHISNDHHRDSLNLYSSDNQHYQAELSASNDYDDSDQEEPRHAQHHYQPQSHAAHHHDDDTSSEKNAYQRQESEHSKFETSSYQYRQSTEDLGDGYHHVEHRHVEFQDEEEVIPSPPASSSLQNSFKLEHKKQIETDEALQFKFTANYQMTEREFKAQKSFFDRIQGGGKASIKLVHNLLLLQTSRSKYADSIQASELDIARSLDAMDSDSDGLINFNQFVDLLQLFFAKSSNIRERIENILNNRSFSNLKSYSLSPEEAKSFLDFLDSFYGSSYSASSSLRSRPEFSERISNAKFAELTSPFYSQLTFIQ